MIAFRAAAVAAVLTMGAVPVYAQQTQAPATDQQTALSDTMVRKVGTALRHVSAIRFDYSQRAQSVESPQRRQEITDQAQQEMVKAVSAQGLSLQQYDQAMQMAQADP